MQGYPRDIPGVIPAGGNSGGIRWITRDARTIPLT